MARVTKAMLEAEIEKLREAHRHDRELEGKLRSQIGGLNDQLRVVTKERDHLRWRMLNTFDGVMLLAERAKASVQELAQLGLARLVGDVIDGKQISVAVAIDLNDLIDMGESAMRQQATVAQFRQLKGHFVVHQRAVSALLDRITSLSRKNSLDGGDMDQLRRLRAELGAMIGRDL